MLIQQLVGAFHAYLVQSAFGFGSAKPRSVGFGLLLRLMPFGALLESFQVDDVAHARLPHITKGGQETFSPTHALSLRALEHFSSQRNPSSRNDMFSIDMVAATKPASKF